MTGVLHMGHMLNNTIQDVLVRRARMQGKNACWVPGVDHASIATEAKVVKKLRDEGLTKQQLGREKFLEHAWAWKEQYGGVMLEQLRSSGASCDWERTRFTMDPRWAGGHRCLHRPAQEGLVYRGQRMVNWDAGAHRRQRRGGDPQGGELPPVPRPLQDRRHGRRVDRPSPPRVRRPSWATAVCVHPDDPRYAHLKGKRCIIPMVERSVPVIFDDYIDMEFGTGCLKVTPAHDINDWEIGQRHGLEVIDTLNPMAP